MNIVSILSKISKWKLQILLLFTTKSLNVTQGCQRFSSRKLKFPAQKTNKLNQSLYVDHFELKVSFLGVKESPFEPRGPFSSILVLFCYKAPTKCLQRTAEKIKTGRPNFIDKMAKLNRRIYPVYHDVLIEKVKKFTMSSTHLGYSG